MMGYRFGWSEEDYIDWAEDQGYFDEEDDDDDWYPREPV